MNKFLFIIFLLISSQSSAAVLRYVAPGASGKGNGYSATDASDFLDKKFWSDVQSLLAKGPVTVKFLEGDYVRAYIEKPLLLADIGHAKNVLTLEGEANKTVFSVPTGYAEKPVLVELKNAQNIIIRNWSFSGSGKLGYALRITSKDGNTKNILVENCSWTDMRGIIYGATGCHRPGTQDVTFKNCVFKRIGIDSHSHHMYHAHGATRIKVLDSHFEDCTGDYVRFRDNCDEITVQGSTFVRNADFPAYPFISIPLFNNVEPGDERFSSNFSFLENKFTNAKFAIAFHNYGFSYPGFSYLLTHQEGALLSNGNTAEKKNILKKNFGIDAEKVLISNNKYTNVITKVGMGSFARYGAVSKGFSGWGDITMLFDSNK